MYLAEGRRTTRRAKARSFAAPLLRVALAIAALWALRRELSGVGMGTLLAHLRAYGWTHVTLGVACTVGSFLVLGVVEILALQHSGGAQPHRVPRRAALGTSFVANALSQSIGVSVLTGAAVRVRGYARYGLDAAAVALTTAFVTITATIGVLAAAAVALVMAPAPIVIGSVVIAARAVAVAFVAIVATYLVWSAAGRGDGIGRGRWRLPRPSLGIAASQVLLSTIDWLLAGSVLFAFMPTHVGLSYGVVLGAYMIAQTTAMTSHVPGGAGVFELVVLALLGSSAPTADRAALVAALVMFRVVYYLVPLGAAIVMAGAVELARARGTASRAHIEAGRRPSHLELWAQRAD